MKRGKSVDFTGYWQRHVGGLSYAASKETAPAGADAGAAIPPAGRDGVRHPAVMAKVPCKPLVPTPAPILYLRVAQRTPGIMSRAPARAKKFDRTGRRSI